MKTEKYDSIVFASNEEKQIHKDYMEFFTKSPLPHDEILTNLGMFLTSKSLSRILFFYEIYKKIVENHGVIFEFGVRWGQTLSILSALRGIFEPFNRHRKITGFDTFRGFCGIENYEKDLSNCEDGSYSVSENYEEYLDKLLSFQERLNPLSHIKKYELIKGDVSLTLPEYLKKHPETIVSLAIFDLDIYTPTRNALQELKPYFCKGTILVFDELCEEIFPGETIALREVLGLNNLKIQRFPMTSRLSYMVLE